MALHNNPDHQDSVRDTQKRILTFCKRQVENIDYAHTFYVGNSLFLTQRLQNIRMFFLNIVTLLK